MRRFLTPILLVCATLLLPTAASADFGDCTDDGYLGRFPDAPAATGLNCVELFSIPVPTPEGERRIRGIQDVSAGWAFAPGGPEAVERGARLTAEALPLLGNFRIDDVTLLLLDDAHSTYYEGARPFLAITDGRRDAAGARPGECLITLFMLGDGGDPAELAINVAHEIFHCLQYASLSSGQMATVGSGGDWWIEGSAEYFAALAVPGSQASTGRGGAFDEAVDVGIALNGMRHEAVVLFHWLHGERGPAGLMPFLERMAVDGSAPAQHEAMRAVLADEDWLRFAQDYADMAIAHPQGGLIASSPSDGTALTFDSNGTREFPLAPFVVSLGSAEYDCGRWRNTLSPENANVAAREIDATGWEGYPAEVDARDAPPRRYRLAALHIDSAEGTLSLEAERTVACEPCGGSDRLDACLVGTWVMSSGGPIEWMESMGVPITSSHSGPRVVRFGDDGVYGTDSFSTGITMESDGSTGRGDGTVTAAAGRWSAADGRLAICQDSGGMSGTATLTTRQGVTLSGPVSQAGAGQLVQEYSCSEGSLTTSLDFPGMEPMVTHYSRSPESRF